MAYTGNRTNSIIEEIFRIMPRLLDERQRRLLAASISKGYGHGGISLVSTVSGMDTRTIRSGIREIENGTETENETGKLRKSGAGRKSVKELEPSLLSDIDLICREYSGGYNDIITWTGLSLRQLSAVLWEKFGVRASKDIVSRALDELGYSKRSSAKTSRTENGEAPDDRQFQFISEKAREFIARNEPVISIDMKKKRPGDRIAFSGKESLETHISENEPGPAADGMVLVDLGAHRDTGLLIMESIRRWWNVTGSPEYPDAKRIYIVLNGENSQKLLKKELAQFASDAGLEIHFSHLPQATSKWNHVRHRMVYCIPKCPDDDTGMDIHVTVSRISSGTSDRNAAVSSIRNAEPSRIIGGSDRTDFRLTDAGTEKAGPCGSLNYVIRRPGKAC